MSPDDGTPFDHTGVARHGYPPGGYRVDATAYTLPHSGVSCHLFNDGILSFFKDLPQKGSLNEEALSLEPGTLDPLSTRLQEALCLGLLRFQIGSSHSGRHLVHGQR